MLSAVPKPKPPSSTKATAADKGHVQTAFRLPTELLDGVDALVDEINETRPWPKMTRSDLVRLVLAKAIEERPDWLMGSSGATR